MAVAGINTIPSTSCGRLFDAVSAILDIRKASTFEGEASTSLQFAADAFAAAQTDNGSSETDVLPDYASLAGADFSWDRFLKMRTAEDGRHLLATDQLVRHIVDETLSGKDTSLLAYGFHAILAKQICNAVRTISKESGINACALTGGCFQNTLLLRLCEDELLSGGMTVYRHSLTPPNDGGLALGQAAYGLYALTHARV